MVIYGIEIGDNESGCETQEIMYRNYQDAKNKLMALVTARNLAMTERGDTSLLFKEVSPDCWRGSEFISIETYELR